MVKLKKSKKKQKHAAPVKLTRKEMRKQKSEEKKQNKRIFFSSKTEGKKLVAEVKKQKEIKNGSVTKTKIKKPKPAINPEDMPLEQLLSGTVDSDNDESIDSDFSDEEVDALLPSSLKGKETNTTAQPSIKKAKVQTSNRPNVEEQHRRELLRQKDLENAARKHRIKQLKIENEEEDKVIATLEKKLGLNKTKNKNRSVRKMFNDGLDFALELCLDDDEEEQKKILKEKRKQELKQQQKEPSWSDEEQDEERFNAIFGSGGETDGSGESEDEGVMDNSDAGESYDDHEEDEDEVYTEDDDVDGDDNEEQGDNYDNSKAEECKYVRTYVMCFLLFLFC